MNTLISSPWIRRSGTLGALLLAIGLQGCAILDCDDYRRYDDILDSWVGNDLEDYERRNNGKARAVMERPRNRLEYEYNTPYTAYDGTQSYCKTWLDVDRDSGKIVNWRYEGDCYMHGYCAD